MGTEQQPKTVEDASEGRKRGEFVRRVLSAYTRLSDTPNRPRPNDRKLVRSWFLRGVPIEHVEAAFVLATLRRSVRSSTAIPLPPIRSLFYFELILEEIERTGLDLEYIRCLRDRMQPEQRGSRSAKPGTAQC